MKERALLAFLVFLSFGAGGVPVGAAQDVPALIKRQSQQFSDASASGDAAVLARLLDKDVVFINESGEIGSKKDVVESAGPPAGVSNRLVQTNVVCRVHGPVAVTSFTDNSTVDFHGQTLHASYLSTEAWLDEGGAWRMISSQTLAIAVDPPAISLPSRVLDEYVGSYRADSSYVFGSCILATGSLDPSTAASRSRCKRSSKTYCLSRGSHECGATRRAGSLRS